jgi:hypothetical protein
MRALGKWGTGNADLPRRPLWLISGAYEERQMINRINWTGRDEV